MQRCLRVIEGGKNGVPTTQPALSVLRGPGGSSRNS